LNYTYKNFLPLLLIVLASSFFYVIAVIFYPGFHTDDYFNFGLAVTNYSNIFSLNFSNLSPYELSHFVIRPVAFINTLLNYYFFGENSQLMKLGIIPIHVAFVFLFYYLLILLSDFFKKPHNPYIALAISLVLSFHPNNFWWVYWIGNQNELYMILFYTLALICVLKYILKGDNKFLWLYLVLFLLSIASKQQGLHLPILVIFALWLFKNKIPAERYKSAMKFSLMGAIFSVVLSGLTFVFFSVDSFKLEYLFKKPFSMFGNLIFVIFPFYSISVYNFFLQNKLLAVIAVILFIVSMVMFAVKKNHLRNLTALFVVTIITFYPRIFETANNRINSIHVLFFCIGLYFFIEEFKIRSKFVYPVLLLFVFLNVLEIQNVSSYCQKINQKIEQEVQQYINSDYSNANVISVAYQPHIFPFELYFLKNKKFGFEKVNLIPIGYSSDLIKDNYDFNSSGKSVKSEIRNDTLIVYTADKKTSLYKEGFYRNSFTGFDKINISTSDAKFPLNYLPYSKQRFIYFNNTEWNEVSR